MSQNPTKNSPWQILSTKPAEEYGPFKTVDSIRKNIRTGVEYRFLKVVSSDWGNVFAVTENQELVMVRQYRQGIEDFTLEIPGGCLNYGEDPTVGCMRELQEETGYTCASPEYLGTLCPNPALQDNHTHYIYAPNVKLTSATNFDSGEDITIELIPFKKFPELIEKGLIVHALHVAGWWMLEKRLKKN